MDANTGLTILGAAIGSAKVVEKMLGPTADYLGGGIRHWTEKRVHNVGRIFEHARIKLGSKIDGEGSVPPKVLRSVLDDGSFCDDELAAEYFGGVLASSRSEVSRDDRGASLAALVSRLTTYQIRSHFFFYNLIKSIFDGDPPSVANNEGRQALRTYVPFSSYVLAMEFGPKENIPVILNHVMFGLAKEDLIDQSFHFGPKDDMRILYGETIDEGIVFGPSALGAELFLWAYGRGDLNIANFLDPEIQFVSETQIVIAPGFKGLSKKTEEPSSTDAEQIVGPERRSRAS
jgi:hypothetical protein